MLDASCGAWSSVVLVVPVSTTLTEERDSVDPEVGVGVGIAIIMMVLRTEVSSKVVMAILLNLCLAARHSGNSE